MHSRLRHCWYRLLQRKSVRGVTLPSSGDQCSLALMRRSTISIRKIFGRRLLELLVPPGKVESRHSSQDYTHTRKRDVGDISLPVPWALRFWVEVRGIDRCEVGASVDDRVSDGAFGGWTSERRRHPRENASERSVDGHHHESCSIARSQIHCCGGDDEADTAEDLRPHNMQPALPSLVRMPGVGNTEDSRKDVWRSGEEEGSRLTVSKGLNNGGEEVDKAGSRVQTQLHEPDKIQDRILESKLCTLHGSDFGTVVILVGFFRDSQNGQFPLFIGEPLSGTWVVGTDFHRQGCDRETDDTFNYE
jgi:hypothetical protein